MQKEFDVLVVGELNVDLILSSLDELPRKGKEIIADEMILTLGSSSAIFAANLSILGTKVCFMGKTGRDQFGEKVLQSLSGKGVDVSHITCSDTSGTGVTVALNYGNERAMVTYPGAMIELAEHEVTDELIRSCRHLHVSSVFLQPVLKQGICRLFQRARNAGITTSLDTQWDPAEQWDCDWNSLLPLTDVFLPNLEEIKNITGRHDISSSIDQIKDIAHTVVIKNGTAGATAWREGRIMQQAAFLNTAVKDAIGAGDSFNAGFIHKFIRQGTLAECLEFGALCGAVNTTAYGGTSAFTSKADVRQTALKFFNYHKNDL